MNINEAETELKLIIKDLLSSKNNIISEEDSKIKSVIRIFTEVLGWRHSNFQAEARHESGFSDLLVSDGGRPAFLVETKRVGEIPVRTAEADKLRHVVLSGSVLKDAQDGINQAYSYAAPEGINIAVVTDGFCWVIFKTFTSGENFKKKECFLFPTINAILNDFIVFYEILSYDGYCKKLYNVHFDSLHNKRNFLTDILKAPIQENEIRITQKSELAFDLDQIFSAFFSRLRGQSDENMLIDCFVETRESRLADMAMEKMAANVLGNISPPGKDVTDELKLLIETAVNIDSGETIFIVGPTGSGKSTFLDRFFRRTLSDSIRNQCVVVSVNCLDSTGREDTALRWYTEVLIEQFESQIYSGGSPSYEELQGLYYSEYERRKKGVDAQLYRRNKEQFKEKFGSYLDEKVETDREGYLRRILADVVSNRKKLPIIILDNTDEFSPDFKRDIFQFSQALRREVRHCLILMPLTDKSAWSFSKTDIYGIYKSKSFFLPTPPPREIFRKRIEYIRQKLREFPSDEDRKKYFVGRGIKLSIDNISNFASVVEDVFVNHSYTSNIIGEICNFNIRRTLELAQRILTSSVFRIEDILLSYTTGVFISHDRNKFLSALLRGDYELYRQSDHHHIFPIFQVDSSVSQSPLIYVRILSLLYSIKNAAKSLEDKHISAQSIIDYFDSLSGVEVSIDLALKNLLESGLIEPYDPSVRDLSLGQKLAITPSGIQHLMLSLFNPVFFEQMAITTSVVDLECVEQIKSLYKAGGYGRLEEIRRKFSQYLVQEDGRHLESKAVGDQFLSQKWVLNAITRFFDPNAGREAAEMVSSFTVQEGKLAVVDWYDPDKGFGFVDVEGNEQQAFIHAERLKEKGIERVFDGDRLLCDVGQNAKGLYIKQIHDFEEDKSNIEEAMGVVIKLFPDRGYAFINIESLSTDAILHRSVLAGRNISDLSLGQMIKVSVSRDKSGASLLVRRVFDLTP